MYNNVLYLSSSYSLKNICAHLPVENVRKLNEPVSFYKHLNEYEYVVICPMLKKVLL